MSLRKSLLVVILLAALPAFADEWAPTRAFRTFSKASWRGLPQSSVVALAQSADGTLWIGTLDGVATFDGRTIAPVADVPGSPLRGLITSIAPRAKGGVYVASQAGVHIFDGNSWRLIATKRGVASVAEGKDGSLWYVDGGGTLWHDAQTAASGVVAVTAAPDGSVWAATDSGAERIAGNRVEPVAGPPLPGRPAAILAASDGRIWVATQACTVHWTRSGADGWHQASFAPWPRGALRALSEDRRGRIWTVSSGGHVAFGNATTPWTVWGPENGPFEAGVMTVLGDREGSVWFGLNAIGLLQWIGESWSHRPSVDPANPTRNAFAAFGLSRPANGHGLLVSVFSAGGLVLGDGTPRLYGAAEGLTEDVRAFVEPEPGTYYAGTRFGVFESHGGGPFRQTLKVPGGFVMGLFKSPDGRWYAATSTAGVFVRDANGWRSDDGINAHLDNKHVRSMLWRRNGDLWIATLRGISIFRGGSFVGNLTSKSEPSIPDSVNALLEISDDEIWAGGTGGIAVRRGLQWHRIGEKDGIPGQTVYSLGRDRNGAIWAGGSAGVGRFANGRWTVWDSREGLLQEECNLNGLLIDDDGSVYVGTMSGLARFDPTVRPLPPAKLQLFWRSTPPVADRALHIRWIAPWLGSHPVQYRFRVPRLHDAWSAPTAEDHLDIENLAAGDWHVDVEARVEGTSDWTAPLTLDLNVPPFWYETFPARLGMGLLLGLIIYAVVRLRIRALRRHAAMLEETVRERTAELAEKVELLRQSEERALAASRAKSAFLANMSHELRTPLNGVLGFAQLLSRRKNRDAEDQEGLATIMRSGEHLLGLINDVLSLSKIEAGRITIEETTFDVRTLVREVETVLRLRADEKRLRFVIEVDDASLPPAVRGDQVRLRRILIHLAGNAVKFTEKGSVTLRARWRDGRAHFEVEDTGPGIAAGELARLFEPFVQSESGQRSKEGTGLGLALSRDLARLMDGDITVESTVGRGSRFVLDVRLPETAALPAVEARRVTALAPGQPEYRVLVVDDTDVNRTVLCRLLAQVGFQVREASNGVDALDVWRSWKPHLIWMDKRMAGIDGLEVTRRIRAEEKGTHTPIIALSASALDHERGEILAAGCDDFVAKPFREATIFEKLQQHLGVRYASEGNVLLVDDDRICREVAVEILRGTGVGVTAVASGREALDLLAKDRFDLVLMDLQMPEMGGIEAARRIRANPATARLPIIAMTAEDERPAGSGMDDYVGKPVEPGALTDVLRRWLP